MSTMQDRVLAVDRAARALVDSGAVAPDGHVIGPLSEHALAQLGHAFAAGASGNDIRAAIARHQQATAR